MIKKNYGNGNTNATEILVDRIQRDFFCCGIDEPKDWFNSQYSKVNSSSTFERGISSNSHEQLTYRIPPSCCDSNYPDCVSRVSQLRDTDKITNIKGIYADGCMQKFEQFIREKWYLILFSGCAIVGVQVFALLFACFLCCAISRHEDK